MGKILRTGPTLLTMAAADILNGGGGSALLYDRIKHIHVENRSTTAVTVEIYIGASGGSALGTGLFKGYSIDAGKALDHYCDYKLVSTEFLTALASALNSLVITIAHEREVV